MDEYEIYLLAVGGHLSGFSKTITNGVALNMFEHVRPNINMDFCQ